MKNGVFYILWCVNLYLYIDLMEFEINTIQYNAIQYKGIRNLFSDVKFKGALKKFHFIPQINIMN
jgi:hypothetical protein